MNNAIQDMAMGTRQRPKRQRKIAPTSLYPKTKVSITQTNPDMRERPMLHPSEHTIPWLLRKCTTDYVLISVTGL
jgi:hypothetical protein